MLWNNLDLKIFANPGRWNRHICDRNETPARLGFWAVSFSFVDTCPLEKLELTWILLRNSRLFETYKCQLYNLWSSRTLSPPACCGSACRKSQMSKGSASVAEKSNVVASTALQMDEPSVQSGRLVRSGKSIESDPKEHALRDSQSFALGTRIAD